MKRLVKLWEELVSDLDVIVARDPASRGRIDAALNTPGWHALVAHRVAHWLWGAERRAAARLLSTTTRSVTGVDIHPAARIGNRVWIDHGSGVVIGETAVVGDGVCIFQGVTLGGTSFKGGKRHPTVEDGVLLGAGAKVLGPVVIGEGSRIGANAVVLTDIPAGSVVVGVPGRVVPSRHVQKPVSSSDITPGDLRERVELLEELTAGLRSGGQIEHDARDQLAADYMI